MFHRPSRLLIIALLPLLVAGCNLTMLQPSSWTLIKRQPAIQDLPASAPESYRQSVSVADTASNDDNADQWTPPPAKTVWERIRRNYKLRHFEAKSIDEHVRWFSRHQNYLDRVADRARPYLWYITSMVEARNMPGEIALLPIIESGFQPFAYSSGRAAGIWQFIPGTGRRYGLKQDWWYDGRRDIVESTRAALDYLQALHKRFDNWPLAIAAYNCGEGTVARAIRKNRRLGKATDFWHLDLPRETRGYVPRLLAISRIVRQPEQYELTLRPIDNQPVLASVETGGQIDLALAADLADMELEQLYRLNPAFNRWATAPDGPHKLLLPISKAHQFRQQLAQLPEDQRITWKRHRIKAGETLIALARQYHTSVKLIQQVNRLKGHRIAAGKVLLMPVASKGQESYVLSMDNRNKSWHKRQRQGQRKIYQVQSGDTLWGIAKQHQISVKQLTRWNGLSARDHLRIGQELALWLPDNSVHNTTRTKAVPVTKKVHYTVKSGESLWHISRRFRVSVNELREWNKLHQYKYLQPGQKLLVYVDVTRQSEQI